MILERFAFGDYGTFGRLTSGDFECFTLERPVFPWVPENARDVAAIPIGQYEIRSGIFHRNTADTGDDYPCITIPDVPGRGPGVKIHAGNTIDSSRGCPLVGDRIGFLDGVPAVLNSRSTLANLVASIGPTGRGMLEIRELRRET